MCLVYTSISIPYLLSAPVGGWIADATGFYWPSIVLSGDDGINPSPRLSYSLCNSFVVAFGFSRVFALLATA
jgi:hypothetical protein